MRYSWRTRLRSESKNYLQPSQWTEFTRSQTKKDASQRSLQWAICPLIRCWHSHSNLAKVWLADSICAPSTRLAAVWSFHPWRVFPRSRRVQKLFWRMEIVSMVSLRSHTWWPRNHLVFSFQRVMPNRAPASPVSSRSIATTRSR